MRGAPTFRLPTRSPGLGGAQRPDTGPRGSAPDTGHRGSAPGAATGWRATETLSRSLVTGTVCALLAVAIGRPDLWVLGAPLLVAGLVALVRRPPSHARSPRVLSVQVRNRSLHEGQATVLRTELTGVPGQEQLTRQVDPTAYVDVRPAASAKSLLVDPAGDTHHVDLVLGARRWGLREVGSGLVAGTSPWAGFRWGPVAVPGTSLTVLPATAGFASRAQAPHPRGLVGAHQSSRVGDGSEFAGIRPFTVGDRLRRVNWRVSLATGELHVVETRAEEDTAVLLLVDALSDVGASDGVDGAASSLDLSVRAASALAEHHLRTGDRVALRVLGPVGSPLVGFGSGSAHRTRILSCLARLRAGRVDDQDTPRLRVRVPDGTVVLMLTPMLDHLAATMAATLARTGQPTVVVDTLPTEVEARGESARSRAAAATAWRLRMLEREVILGEVARAGCPVVPWRGPGTLDDVMRRLARRAQLPRVMSR
ncbi:MAG: DUF58 domain-containing protein [Marmoricola sp.]